VIMKDLKFPQVKINIVGFSQGTSTVARWIVNGNIKVDQVVLWAGLFPPDIDFKKSKKLLNSIPILIVAGKRDPWVNNEVLNNQIQVLKNSGINPQLKIFNGGHEINPQLLKEVL